MKLDPHAAVVGIDAYGHGLDLQTAGADASALAELLRETYGYRVDSLLLDAEATAEAVLGALERAKELPEGACFLFYFAGHGTQLGEATGDLAGFLLPHGARRDDPTTWLPMDDLRRALDELRCRHVLVILDCCFGGSFRWAGTRNIGAVGKRLFKGQLLRYLKRPAWQVLTSTSHNEKALDFLTGHNPRDALLRDSRHSPFAAALLEGLSGKADSLRGDAEADGVVTATELHQYVFEKLVPIEGRALQTPLVSHLKPESTGEYVFFLGDEPDPAPDPPLDADNNPWLGLGVYDRKDRERFFGREAETESLCAAIRDRRTVVVLGPSGSGKSSLVRAGVIPRLEQPEGQDLPWTTVTLPRLGSVDLGTVLESVPEPRGDPEDGSKSSPVLVLIDQFEELFTQCAEEDQEPFIAELRARLDSNPRLRLLLTVRSDFEPQLRAPRCFGPGIARAVFHLTPPGAEQLRRIVEEPARQKALFFEPPELVDEIVEDVLAMPGALPMVSFALAEVYLEAVERRRLEGPDRALTRADFDAAGGVVGSLHNRAGSLYDEAPSARQEMIRWIFLRMVSQEGGRLARRRVHELERRRAEDAENQLLEEAVDAYVKAGLVTADDGFVEPGHDTLVVAWPRLLRWIRQESDYQGLIRDLWTATRAWATSEEKDGLLWTDNPRLPQLVDLRSRLSRGWAHLRGLSTRPIGEVLRDRASWLPKARRLDGLRPEAARRLNDLEQRFVRRSARRYHRKRRALRRGRATFFVMLVAFSVYSWLKTGEARRLAETAESRLRIATGNALLDNESTSTASLVALELKDPGSEPLSTRLMHKILVTDPELVRLGSLPVEPGAAPRADWSGDGTQVLLADGAGLRIWRPAESASKAGDTVVLWRPDPFVSRPPLEVPESEEKKSDKEELGDGFETEGQPAGPQTAEAVALSRGGSLAAALVDRREVLVWRLGTDGEWTEGDPFELPPDAVGDGAFSRLRWRPTEKGARLLVVSGGGPALVWEPRAAEARRLPAKSPLLAAAWSPDGKRLLTASEHTVELWATSDGRRLETLPLPRAKSRELPEQEASGLPRVQVDWVGSGITALWDGVPRLWDAKEKRWKEAPIDGPALGRAVWSPGGRRLLGLTRSETAPDLLVWETGQPAASMRLAVVPMKLVAWSADGSRLMTVSKSSVDLWPVAPELLQEHLRQTFPHCLSPRERQELFQEPALEASAAAGACESCVTGFFAELERAAVPGSEALHDAWRSYRRCLEAPPEHLWEPKDPGEAVLGDLWFPASDVLRAAEETFVDAEIPTICRVRLRRDLVPGEVVENGERCLVVSPEGPADGPDAGCETPSGPAPWAVRCSDFELFVGEQHRWSSEVETIGPVEEAVAVGGRAGRRPTPICGVPAVDGSRRIGKLVDGACWMGAEADPETLGGFDPRAVVVGGPRVLKAVSGFQVLRRDPSRWPWVDPPSDGEPGEVTFEPLHPSAGPFALDPPSDPPRSEEPPAPNLDALR